MVAPGSGCLDSGSTGAGKRDCEKFPARSAAVGTLVTRVIPSRSRVQDLYLNMEVSLGQAPPGKYNIKFTVRDLNSKKSVSATQEVTFK